MVLRVCLSVVVVEAVAVCMTTLVSPLVLPLRSARRRLLLASLAFVGLVIRLSLYVRAMGPCRRKFIRKVCGARLVCDRWTALGVSVVPSDLSTLQGTYTVSVSYSI